MTITVQTLEQETEAFLSGLMAKISTGATVVVTAVESELTAANASWAGQKLLALYALGMSIAAKSGATQASVEAELGTALTMALVAAKPELGAAYSAFAAVGGLLVNALVANMAAALPPGAPVAPSQSNQAS